MKKYGRVYWRQSCFYESSVFYCDKQGFEIKEKQGVFIVFSDTKNEILYSEAKRLTMN